MADRNQSPKGILQKLWAYFAEDVPAEIARCEFDCPQRECRQGEWAACEKRRSAEIALTALERDRSNFRRDPRPLH